MNATNAMRKKEKKENPKRTERIGSIRIIRGGALEPHKIKHDEPTLFDFEMERRRTEKFNARVRWRRERRQLGLPVNLIGKKFTPFVPVPKLMSAGGYIRLPDNRGYIREWSYEYRYHITELPEVELQLHTDKFNGKGKRHIASVLKVKEEVARLQKLFPFPHEIQLRSKKKHKFYKNSTVPNAEVKRLIEQLPKKPIPFYKKIWIKLANS